MNLITELNDRMMRRIIKWLATYLLVVLSVALPGQEPASFQINGTVTDANGDPIAGVGVYANEGSEFTLTGPEGNFTIESEEDGILVFEAHGFASRQAVAQEVRRQQGVTLSELPLQMYEGDLVNIPFGTRMKKLIASSVSVLNAKEILTYDSRQNVYGVINGRVPGVFGNLNVHGLGNAVVVVDGIPRPAELLNLQEVEQITVLKDAASRLMYGVQADLPVILVTTKRGEAFRRKMNVVVESGIGSPISYPDFLNAADYMEHYNAALVSDGLSEKYSLEQIQNTRSGVDPYAYPDEQYYNERYLKNSSNYLDVITEASGGNERAKYYANLGWSHSTGLLKVGRGAEEQQNRINLRGNVDFDINDWMSMHADGVALLYINREARSNAGGHPFWTYASEFHPEWYPSLIPYSRVNDPDSALYRSAVFVDSDHLLGGTSEYDQNIYGDLTRAGYQNQMIRTMQFNTGLDTDLGFLAEGLSARGYLSFDLYNVFNTIQQNSYSVYQPLRVNDTTNLIDVQKFNEDVRSGTQTVADPSFFRRVGLFGVVDYARVFGDHDLDITGVAYRDQIQYEDALQATKHLHFGAKTAYAFRSRYLAELTAVVPGSPRFAEGNRFGFSPAVALGWVVSDEPFLENSGVIDFLKLKGSWGIINTDEGFADYYLYQTTFTQGGWFDYNNGVNRNRRRYFGTIGNPDISWIKRSEINLGLEARLFGGLWLEAAYFNIRNYDVLTERVNYYTDFLDEFIPYENYNAFLDRGAELGLNYTTTLSRLELSFGTGGVYAVSEVLQLDEPIYDVEYRQRAGKPTDAIFGWVAEGLFQDQEEIDAHAVQTFGTVQPGDIKYRDLNSDGIIDDNDQEMIGVNTPRLQYSLNLRLRYGAFELFALGTGQYGDQNIYSQPYYWVYGDRKYSDVVRGSWTMVNDKSTATYPRLTTRSSSNNFRTSTYWLEDNNWFSLHTLQLTATFPYHMMQKTFFKGFRIYARGTNLLMISEIKEKKQLNIGTAPQMRYISLGVTASF